MSFLALFYAFCYFLLTCSKLQLAGFSLKIAKIKLKEPCGINRAVVELLKEVSINEGVAVFFLEFGDLMEVERAASIFGKVSLCFVLVGRQKQSGFSKFQSRR